jgi:hypothetical protein
MARPKHDQFYRDALARGLPPHEAEVIAERLTEN